MPASAPEEEFVTIEVSETTMRWMNVYRWKHTHSILPSVPQPLLFSISLLNFIYTIYIHRPWRDYV
jgi:hypothetical protein